MGPGTGVGCPTSEQTAPPSPPCAGGSHSSQPYSGKPADGAGRGPVSGQRWPQELKLLHGDMEGWHQCPSVLTSRPAELPARIRGHLSRVTLSVKPQSLEYN